MRVFSAFRKIKLSRILIGVLLAVVLVFVLAPSTHLRLGNFFFGDSPEHYSVDLAQVFFVYAAYSPVWFTPEYAHYQLSRTHFIKGNQGAALFEAKKEIELYPENYQAYYILGLTYGYMDREEEGIVAFKEFIKHVPLSWAARNDAAWLQFRIGDIEGALETIEPVAHLHNTWVQNTYGVLLLNSGREEEALEAFKNAEYAASLMSPEDWGEAYPGNDPRIYSMGLGETKSSIDSNLELLEEQ